MKKLSIFILLVFFSGAITAQETVVTWDGLKSQKEKSDQEIQVPKKSVDSKTWAKRADVYIDIHTFEISGLYKGMPASGNGLANAEYLVGKPGKKLIEGESEVWVYSRKKLYFVNGLLDKWEQTEFIDENAIEKAAEAYINAIKFDEKGKYQDKSTSRDLLFIIKNNIINEGVTLYTNEKYLNSYKLMSIGYELCKLPKNESDTIFKLDQVGFFLGVIAFKAEKYDVAKYQFENSIKNEYNPGLSYHHYAECFLAEGDSSKYINIVKGGFEKYPDEEQLIIDIINYYMVINKVDQAVEYIDVAINKNPDNPSYYSAKATIYDNKTDAMLKEYIKFMDEAYEYKKEAFRVRNNPKLMDQAEKKRDAEVNKALEKVKLIEENLKIAEELYDKSLKINDKFFNAAYNLARLYLKRNERNALHADYILKITMPKDFAKSSEYENLAKEQLKTAAEKFEKAHEISPNDKDVLETLKRIYYRLKDKDNQTKVEEKLAKLVSGSSNSIE